MRGSCSLVAPRILYTQVHTLTQKPVLIPKITILISLPRPSYDPSH